MKDKIIKDTMFNLKIADLLYEVGKEDQILFDHKFSLQLPTLTDEGIAGVFTIQSLNSGSLLGTLTDVTATFHDTCESCGIEFDRFVKIPSYTARFVFERDVSDKEKQESEEALFFIDPKDETINIEDMIVQSILLNEPFVKRCPACIERLEYQDGDEEDIGEYTSKGNIIFS